MIEGCRTRGEGGKGTAATSTSCFTFFPKLGLSNFLLPARGPRQGQGRPGNTHWQGETNRKESEIQKELGKSIKSQLPLLLPIFGCKVKISGSTRHTLNLSCPHIICGWARGKRWKGTETNKKETKLEAQKSQFASLVTGVVVGRQGTTGYSSSPPPTVASKLNLDSRRPDPSMPWRWW